MISQPDSSCSRNLIRETITRNPYLNWGKFDVCIETGLVGSMMQTPFLQASSAQDGSGLYLVQVRQVCAL